MSDLSEQQKRSINSAINQGLRDYQAHEEERIKDEMYEYQEKTFQTVVKTVLYIIIPIFIGWFLFNVLDARASTIPEIALDNIYLGQLEGEIEADLQADGTYKFIPEYVYDGIFYEVHEYVTPEGYAGYDIQIKKIIGKTTYIKVISYGLEKNYRSSDWSICTDC